MKLVHIAALRQPFHLNFFPYSFSIWGQQLAMVVLEIQVALRWGWCTRCTEYTNLFK